jgi:hypothetical protein
VAVIPGGPDWASIMTAFGTVGAAGRPPHGATGLVDGDPARPAGRRTVPADQRPGVQRAHARGRGVRFYGEFGDPGRRPEVYPVVRWTDQRGTGWEHRRGQVRQIQDGEPWRP